MEQRAAAASSLRMQAQELVQAVAVFRRGNADAGELRARVQPLALMAA
jgi:methyl-accepting chemotaxis protein-1 (serine sensor receptor)